MSRCMTDVRAIVSRLTKPMVYRGAASYLEGERIAGFSETPNSYALFMNGDWFPTRAVVALAVRDGLGLILTSSDLASSNTTVCRQVLESLGFEFRDKSLLD